MAIGRLIQDPLGLTADFVNFTSTARLGLLQNHPSATSISTGTTSNLLTLPAIITTKISTFPPIETLVTSFLYKGSPDSTGATAITRPASSISEPSTNVHSHFPEFGNLAVTPYQLMYIVAACVCFVILMSFCCCTDDIGRYMKSNRNNTGATVQAAPVWPGTMRFMDGANDTSRSDRASRNYSAVSNSPLRLAMPQPVAGSDSPSSSTKPPNFTKITIKTCEEGHDSIIIDEIELQHLSLKPSHCDFSNSNPAFTHEYVTANPQASVRNGRVSLRGGSGTGDDFIRTGAITSFKQTEERWKPTWSATKLLFSSRRRESEVVAEQTVIHSMSNHPTTSDIVDPPFHNSDRTHHKSSTTTSKRAARQTNTSGTTFSFPLSDGSDSEIPRFPTINRIKQKLKPLVHSVSKQSLRRRFSSAHHSGSQSTEGADSDEFAYSNTVKKALRRARSSASIPFGLFKLPDPAIDEPDPSDAGPISMMSNNSPSDDSDTASENTMRARSPVSTLLGVRTERRSGSSSGYKSKSIRQVILPLDSMECVLDEADLADAEALQFSNSISNESENDKEKEIKLMCLKRALASNCFCVEDKDEDEVHITDPKHDETKDSRYVTCRSKNRSEEENDGGVIETEQEQSDAPRPSYINSTQVM
ncbi:6b9a8145-387e-4997-8219-740d33aa470c-CDS [Sclerotinia trifoliorum]|uniref:6b9a8145-387e-4997-8219-740d33aa470c-CDS n=1 Tax=Sclerotinia trifoliorum TaxID=28548 RepID=A0A8H2W409_9HELO|nr:6b9a8145-387e-4997-8219-740d33aa470c-CDS [Sclerotinia trifoliorum]